MRAQKNNKGFSLIEILVAVTVLAIITVPLLHGFLSAARLNAAARKTAQATTAAWNVMEEIKALPAEKILKDTEKITKKSKPGDPESRQYYEYTYGAVLVDGETYDAVVSLDPNVYSADPDRFPEVTEYNEKEMARLCGMDPSCDASWLQQDGTDEKMAAMFSGIDQAFVKQNMERSIIVDISKTNHRKTVSVSLKYTCNGSTKYLTPQTQCIYANSEDTVELRNIFLFFWPMYNSAPGEAKEQITIRNNDRIPVNIYLIRQQAPSVHGNEADYQVDVNVLEADREDSSYLDGSGSLSVLTHIRSNLSDTADFSSSPAVYRQMNLLYGVSDGSFASDKQIITDKGTQVKSAAELLDFKDLAAEAEQEFIYNVKVDIYGKGEREDGKEALVSLTGTKEK